MAQSAITKQADQHRRSTLSTVALILWRLSSSDILTFVLPNTLFGVCTALCTPMWKQETLQLTQFPASWHSIVAKTSKTLIWNWLNLLLFNLSNQRLPDSVAEDKLNKPYRPIPSGLLSPAAARQALLYGIFVVSSISYFWLGAYEESIIMVGLNWTYNDLRGGDENFVLRNLIIAIAFGVHNYASSRIMRGFAPVMVYNDSSLTRVLVQPPQLSLAGQQWIVLVSLIILTTMQIQDLQDVEGDRKRGRRSLMLVIGMKPSRWFTAIPIVFWCGVVPYILQIRLLSLPLFAMVCLGFYTAWRVLFLTSKSDDNHSWKIWALWLISIYVLPLMI